MELSARNELQLILLASRDDEARANVGNIAVGSVGAYAGGRLVYRGAPMVLGKQRFYHGTSKENADKIRKEGFKVEYGGKNGSSAHVNSDSYIKNSTGHIHVTPSKRVASAFATLNGISKSASESDKMGGMLKGAVLRSKGRGEVVTGYLPYDKFQKGFHLDPDMSGPGTLGRVAFRTTEDIAKENIGHKALFRGVSAKGVADYAMKNKKRFAGGLGLIGIGAAGIAAGGSLATSGFMKKEKQLSARDELNLILFGEKKDNEHRPIRGTLGGLILPSIAAQAVGIGSLAAATNPLKHEPVPVNKGDAVAMRYLRREAYRQKAKIHETSNPLMPGAAWDHKASGGGYLEKAGRAQIEAMTGSKDERGVIMGKGVRAPMKPGILAHEVGHLKGHRALIHPATRIAGVHGGSLASLYAGLTSDEEGAKKAAIIGSIAAAPMLASEVDASVRGAGLLHKAGVKGMRRLTPGIGLASYAAVAGMPAATYLVKKSLGGYKKKEPQEQKLSARNELSAILFEDPRPRNALGMFSGGGEGGPNPMSMAITYQGPQQPQMQQAPQEELPPEEQPKPKQKKIMKRDTQLSAREELNTILFGIRERVGPYIHEAEEYIRENPGKAVGIAGGMGFLTGVIARKPSKEAAPKMRAPSRQDKYGMKWAGKWDGKSGGGNVYRDSSGNTHYEKYDPKTKTSSLQRR